MLQNIFLIKKRSFFYYFLLVVFFVVGFDLNRARAEEVVVSCSDIDRVILVANTSTTPAAGVRVRVKPQGQANTSSVGKLFSLSFSGQNAHSMAYDIAQSLKNCESVTFVLSGRRSGGAYLVNLSYITLLSK